MRYIDVQWVHEVDSDPVRLLSEIDDDGYEIRKIEVYRDGRADFADDTQSTGNTLLGEGPVPSDDEIEGEEFRLSATSASDFNEAWIAVRTSGRYSPSPSS